MTDRRIEMPALSFRAAVQSVNERDRTFDVIFSTGAAVRRVDKFGTVFSEELSLAPEHVRLERLNAGAPLLNSHSAMSVHDVIGVVFNARVDGIRGYASVRFSKRDEAQDIWRDVADGIVRAVSVGYVVDTYRETPASKPGALPVRLAVDWTPYELSLVAMPADAGAKVRSAFAPIGDFATVLEQDAARLARLEAAKQRQRELDRRYL